MSWMRCFGALILTAFADAGVTGSLKRSGRIRASFLGTSEGLLFGRARSFASGKLDNQSDLSCPNSISVKKETCVVDVNVLYHSLLGLARGKMFWGRALYD